MKGAKSEKTKGKEALGAIRVKELRRREVWEISVEMSPRVVQLVSLKANKQQKQAILPQVCRPELDLHGEMIIEEYAQIAREHMKGHVLNR